MRGGGVKRIAYSNKQDWFQGLLKCNFGATVVDSYERLIILVIVVIKVFTIKDWYVLQAHNNYNI
jgi:hypothetical protein